MADQPKPPLWRVLASVFAGWTTYPPQPPRCYWAALIRALADWLVPEEHGVTHQIHDPDLHRSRQREELRNILLDEANRAEAGE
jgi:hypothetical protein